LAVSKPNQFTPVRRTGCPDPSTIVEPEIERKPALPPELPPVEGGGEGEGGGVGVAFDWLDDVSAVVGPGSLPPPLHAASTMANVKDTWRRR
jgi:hypothetical protein